MNYTSLNPEFADSDNVLLQKILLRLAAGSGGGGGPATNVTATLVVEDIEIGAVELKNGTDDTRVTVFSRPNSNPVAAQVVDSNGDPLGVPGNPFSVDGSAVTQPISAVSLPLPTGAAAEHVTAVSPHAVRLSDGAAFYKATTPADTQPVSVASLPLPAGAATEATLAALNAKVTAVNTGAVTISTALPAGANTIGKVDQGAGGASAWKVDGSSVTQPVSGAVSVSNFPAPLSVVGGGTEAAALRVTLANDSTGLVSVNDDGGSLTVDSPQLPAALGQTTKANSFSVVLASDQSGVADPNNSSTTPLAGGGVFTGTFTEVLNFSEVQIQVQSNAPAGSAVLGFQIQNSQDGITALPPASSYTVGAAGAAVSITFKPVSRYYRVVYTNGATLQSTFRLQATLRQLTSGLYAMNTTPTANDMGIVTRNLPTGTQTVSVTGTVAITDSEKLADASAFTQGTTKVQPSGFLFDDVAGELTDMSPAENNIAAARIDSKRTQLHVIEDATIRGRKAGVTIAGELRVKPKDAEDILCEIRNLIQEQNELLLELLS